MKISFAFVALLATTPVFAFECPAGAHLCSRPAMFWQDTRYLCVQFNATTIQGINDSSYHAWEFDFQTKRHWSGCRTVFGSRCVDQWVKISDSHVHGYKYSYSPYQYGGSTYEYLDIDLKGNRATLRTIYNGEEMLQNYDCHKLTDVYRDPYYRDIVIPVLPPPICEQHLSIADNNQVDRPGLRETLKEKLKWFWP